jgi:hypothetical protein
MRTTVLVPSLLAAAIGAGCGGGTPPSALPPVSALHGGILVPLPGDQGYVEILNDQRERKGRSIQTNVVAYLLQSDQKTPFAQKPTSVTVKLDTAGGSRSIPLLPRPDGGDPAGGSRFVSDFGPFDLNMIAGEVTVAVDGKTLTGSFRGPR